MSVVAAAITTTAVIGAGMAYYASEEEKKAAKEAQKAQEAMADKSIDSAKTSEQQQREDFAPWREAGEKALAEIQEGISTGAFDVGEVDVTKDPGYQFRAEEGVKALDKSAAARGRLLSGAQQKGIANYSQNLASQEYANAYARESNEKARKFNMLSGISSQGQGSAAGQAAASGSLGMQSANIFSNLGNQQALSAQQQGQARAGAYRGGAQALNQAAQNWLTYDMNKPTSTNNAMSSGNSSYNPMGGGY